MYVCLHRLTLDMTSHRLGPCVSLRGQRHLPFKKAICVCKNVQALARTASACSHRTARRERTASVARIGRRAMGGASCCSRSKTPEAAAFVDTTAQPDKNQAPRNRAACAHASMETSTTSSLLTCTSLARGIRSRSITLGLTTPPAENFSYTRLNT